MAKHLTAEESHRKAMRILGKLGHLSKCVRCGEPDDRKAEDKLCRKCHNQNLKAERERLLLEAEETKQQEAERIRQEKYKGRCGAWA